VLKATLKDYPVPVGKFI